MATENFLTKAVFLIYLDFDIHLKTALNKQTNKQINKKQINKQLLTDKFVSNKYRFIPENMIWHFLKTSTKFYFDICHAILILDTSDANLEISPLLGQ